MALEIRIDYELKKSILDHAQNPDLVFSEDMAPVYSG